MNTFDWKKYGFTRVTSPYGWRNDPFNGKKVCHTGVDLVKSHQAPIHAFTGGEVVHAGMGAAGSGFGGFGNVVAVKDSNGYLQCYAHLDSISVAAGQIIQAGQELGTQGTTGLSTGSHLHYEVRSTASPSFGFGRHTDPGCYLSSCFSEQSQQECTQERKAIPIRVNNQPFCEGFLEGSITYAPLRAISEQLGARVGWDGKEAAVNGIRMLGGKIIDGRTYIPVRAFEEAIEVKVVWNGQEVNIVQ
ncbi:peptidoglycan DD-metalloendopeptidase family protein [Paenibacillus apiarius]|uniref:peptidoglycan DD-metalloendopeptidase family protein n=1 Tax=Paenibacillus apiarius TaxID=46240 RepID=UPI00197CF875|nr:peptidoglycan DD-metalloendopeptidase family protein [Paenibacillus apiarius]MBN3522262.1 peptidoglycan DD-metalloendopeptidase family protein [Paenibacillus apiarius]